jgi:hypothetical protein
LKENFEEQNKSNLLTFSIDSCIKQRLDVAFWEWSRFLLWRYIKALQTWSILNPYRPEVCWTKLPSVVNYNPVLSENIYHTYFLISFFSTD